MLALVLSVLIMGAWISLSIIVAFDEDRVRNPAVLVGALILVSLSIMVGSRIDEGIVLLAYAVGTGLGAMYFLAQVFSLLVERGATILRGDHQLQQERTHDRAEAAKAKGDREGALALYRESIAEDPPDYVAWRRIAEIHVELGQLEEAVEALESAITAIRIDAMATRPQALHPEEEIASVRNRLADLYLDHLGDPDRARAELEKIIEEARGTRSEEMARRRLETLELRESGP